MADCSFGLYSGNETVHLVYDSDVEGIGQLISFVLVAVASTVLVTIHFLFSTEASEVHTTLFTNPIDARIRHWVAGRKTKLKISRNATIALEGIALTLSDTQLVTGIAILVSAWAQFSDIRTYYWNIAWRLAWLASVTHLATLTTLRVYFRDRPVLRTVRLLLMLILLLLIITAALPTSCAGRSTVVSVRCAWSALAKGGCNSRGGYPSAAVSLVLLLASFLVRFIKMTHNGAVWVAGQLRRRPSRWSKSLFKWLSSRPKVRFLCYIVLPLRNTLQLTADLLQSSFLEILWIYLSLAWGLLALFQSIQSIDDTKRWYDVSNESGRWTAVSRNSEKPLPNTESSAPNRWAFGQIVPLVLLILPVLTIIEMFFGDASDDHISTLNSAPTTRVDPIGRPDPGLIQHTTSNVHQVLETTKNPRQVHTTCASGGQSDIEWLQDAYLNGYFKLQIYIIVSYNVAVSAVISTSARLFPSKSDPVQERIATKVITSLSLLLPFLFVAFIFPCYVLSAVAIWSAVKFDHDGSKRLKKRLLYSFAWLWMLLYTVSPFAIAVTLALNTSD